MKKNIHPSYNDVTVNCNCGNSFTIGSVLEGVLHVDVCNDCHPFYTGKQKIIDTAGRVDSFNRRFGVAMAKPAAAK